VEGFHERAKRVLPFRFAWCARLLPCLFLALLVFGADVAAAQTAIRFDQEVYTFQPVLEGDSVEVTFAFRNMGSQPLVIHDVSTSCGCTTAEYPSGPLKPGERGAVRTTFRSRGYSGDVGLTLVVKSNDAKDPMRTLYIRGKVVRQWQVRPDRLVLTNLAAHPTAGSMTILESLTVSNRLYRVDRARRFHRSAGHRGGGRHVEQWLLNGQSLHVSCPGTEK